MAEELTRSREGARRESALRFGCGGEEQARGCQTAPGPRKETNKGDKTDGNTKRRDGGDCTHLPHKETQMGSDACFRGSHLAPSCLAAHETPAPGFSLALPLPASADLLPSFSPEPTTSITVTCKLHVRKACSYFSCQPAQIGL